MTFRLTKRSGLTWAIGVAVGAGRSRGEAGRDTAKAAAAATNTSAMEKSPRRPPTISGMSENLEFRPGPERQPSTRWSLVEMKWR
jgi:hypothetical protein